MPIAASKDAIVRDLSLSLGGFVLAGVELAIVGEGGEWEIEEGVTGEISCLYRGTIYN